MDLAIDAVGNRAGGGRAVLFRTVSHLLEDHRIDRVTVFCSPQSTFDEPLPRLAGVTWVPRADAHAPSSRMGWYASELDRASRQVGADVVLALNGMGRTRLPLVSYVQQAFVFTGRVRDVRPAILAAKLGVIRRATRRHVHNADRVLVPSAWMQQHAAVADVAAEVCMLGLPERRTPQRSRGPVVWVGADLSYKRRDLAVAVAQRLSSPVTLVQGWSAAATDEAITGASALLVTSELESLGLPVLEAFASGVPVVAFDASWVRPLAGDAVEIVANVGEAAAAIARLASEPDHALALQTAGAARLAELADAAPYSRLAEVLAQVAR